MSMVLTPLFMSSLMTVPCRVFLIWVTLIQHNNVSAPHKLSNAGSEQLVVFSPMSRAIVFRLRV